MLNVSVRGHAGAITRHENFGDRHRVEAAPDCGAGCYSRLNCVLGPEHCYRGDEIRYHQERALRSMHEYYRSQWGERT